ncbi:hypothetical protein [Microvirga pudoricolor]|uniref:hypothetical protein n=1 Tax=Microvirga pudoricolor TaxID=2778729 RepID=UPI0019515258|nr:hypothetical protein [Microvirga pudoricolor]MBM6596437.1 hypothetical protein [Microvirga pudoricolor]
MQRALFATLIALSASACAYSPSPDEQIHTVDSPADIRYCTRLAEVSPILATGPGFASPLAGMQEQTLAMGGTHLYLEKRSEDWALTRGIAYRCGSGTVREVTVIRAKG